MSGGRVKRIEANLDRAAAGLFAAAVGYAAYTYLTGQIGQPVLGAETGGAGALAYVLCARTLKAIRPKPRFAVPIFDLRKIDPSPMEEELLLTEEDRLPADSPPVADAAGGALVLDDILAELGPNSRVVRLLDPAAMPTPGQLNARIERHLDRGAPGGAPPDASQALFDALADLRRSLG